MEFNSKGWNGWNLEGSLVKLTSVKPSFCVCLLGGLFFKMLTGGLTFGFLVVNERFLVDEFNITSGLNKPHSLLGILQRSCWILWSRKQEICWLLLKDKGNC